MTMPHLMNCDHSHEGWCLACVKREHDEAADEIDRLRQFEQRCKELERLVCSEYRVVLVGVIDDFELWRVVATEYESELINGEVMERDTQQAAIAAAIKLLREKAGDAT